jgi:hypothetical protein
MLKPDVKAMIEDYIARLIEDDAREALERKQVGLEQEERKIQQERSYQAIMESTLAMFRKSPASNHTK